MTLQLDYVVRKKVTQPNFGFWPFLFYDIFQNKALKCSSPTMVCFSRPWSDIRLFFEKKSDFRSDLGQNYHFLTKWYLNMQILMYLSSFYLQTVSKFAFFL